VRDGYVVSGILEKNVKHFSDGEIRKDFLEAVADVALPDKIRIKSKLYLSRFTDGRRVKELPNNVEESLTIKAAIFQWLSTASDKSTDVNDTVQLAVFVLGIGMEFNIAKKLASLMAVKGTTTAADLFQKVKKELQNLNVQVQKLGGLVMNGAPEEQ
jgi:hypothetical protein